MGMNRGLSGSHPFGPFPAGTNEGIMPKCCATWRGGGPCAHSARNMDGQSVSPLAQFHVISVDRIGGELRVYGTTIRWNEWAELHGDADAGDSIGRHLDMFALRPRRLACAARNAYSHSDERVQSQVAASRRIVGQHPPNSKHHGGAVDKAGKVFI